jgi:hypothetical protein
MGINVGAEGRFYTSCPVGSSTELKQKLGKAGDVVGWIWIKAGTGTVALKDGAVTVFTWDAQTAERFIPLDIASKNGGWSVETSGVSALASGSSD